MATRSCSALWRLPVLQVGFELTRELVEGSDIFARIPKLSVSRYRLDNSLRMARFLAIDAQIDLDLRLLTVMA
jgi:hypothetical protein